MTPPKPSITVIIAGSRGGSGDARKELFDRTYEDLRAMARRHLSRERKGHTLDSVALVGEVYENVMKAEKLDLESRAHYFGVLANAMRRVLVDHARARLAEKRGGGARPVSTDDVQIADRDPESERILAVDQALDRLAEIDAEAAEVVNLRFFVGLSEEQAAEKMNLGRATVGRRWAFAKAWLRRELGDGFQG